MISGISLQNIPVITKKPDRQSQLDVTPLKA